MIQRIIESNKINKKGGIYTIYNGFWDYISTKFWVGILLLPFIIIFLICKYIYSFFKFVMNRLTNFIIKKNTNISKTNANIISAIIIVLICLIVSTFAKQENSNIQNEINISNTHNNIKEEKIVVSRLNDFITNYNNISNIKVTNVSNFDVSDKNSTHYRTEYRLLTSAEGISAFYNNYSIDIVYDKIHNYLRIYNTSNRECIKDILLNVSNVLNCNASENEINELFNNNYTNIIKLGNIATNGYIDGNTLFIGFNY